MAAAVPASERPASMWPWAAVGLIVAGLVLVPLARAWQVAPDLGHGWAAPLLMFYLWWERWAERPPVGAPARAQSTGFPVGVILVVLLLAAIPLRLILTPYPVWPVALTLYVGGLVAVSLWLVWRHFGRAGVVWVGGPLLLLPGVMPWPGMVESTLILPIREAIAVIVAEASNLFGAPALASGTSVRLANGWVGIDEACGGIRSLHAAVTTALFFGEWLRLSAGRRIALFGVGLLAAMGGNLGRVGFLSWCATGPDGMLDRWHDTAGWMALGFSLVVTGLVGWRWSSRRPDQAKPSIVIRPAARALPPIPQIPMMVLAVTAGMLALEGGTRWWYAQGSTVSKTEATAWTAALPTDSPTFVHQPLSDAANDMLRPDAFVSGAWVGVDGVRRMVNYVEWHEGQAARYAPFFHNPTVCLPASGAELIETLGTVEIPWGDTVIPFESYIFRQLNQELVVAFTVWDPSTGAPLRTPRPDAGWWGWMRTQWRDVAEAREHQPAQLMAFAIEGREHQGRLLREVQSLLATKEDASKPD